MTRCKVARLQALVLGVFASVLFWIDPALALDAPKWVAAMHMEAQAQVGLRWLPVPGAVSYKVLRSTTAGQGYAEIAAPAQPQHFDASLTPGTTYYYVLQAVSGTETSPNSLERSVLVKESAKIASPELTLVEMDQKSGGIKVQWKPVPGGVAFNVYRRESFKPEGKEDLIGSVQDAEPYLDKTNLRKGVEYIYSVSVLDEKFTESPKSTSRSAKFTPKEEVKVVAKKVEAVADNYAVKFLGAAKYVPAEGSTRQGQVNAATVAFCDGELYVHYTSGEILVFDEKLEIQRRLVSGEGKFPGMMNFFVCGEDDDLLGVFWQTRQVLHVNKENGDVTSSFSVEDGYDPQNPLDKGQIRPTRVAWNEDEILVADAGNHTIRVFNKKGKLLRRMGKFGLKAGEFSYPADMIFMKDGGLAVLEAANARVQVFGADGESKYMFGESGKRLGQFARASGLAYDPKKDLFYVSDYVSSVIHVWNTDGSSPRVIKFSDSSTQKAFNSVAGVTLGSNGVLYAIDYGTTDVLALKDEH